MKIQQLPQPQRASMFRSEAPPPQQFRPLTEHWKLDGMDFSSTRDLVSAASQIDGKSATYQFTTDADAAPFQTGERVRNAVGAGLTGGLTGAVAGGLVGGGLVLLAGIGDLLSMLALGRPGAHSSALVTVPLALGAAIGAGVGAASGWKDEGKATVREVTGTLKREHAADGTATLAFYPLGQLDRRVDLGQYQHAPAAPVPTPDAPQGAGVHRIQGALLGAAAPLATMIPIAGLVAGTVAGAAVGKALDPRTQLGQGLGAVVGTGFTVASGASLAAALNGGSWLPLAALSMAGAATGALVGDKVLGSPSEPGPQFGNSWWTAYRGED